MAGNSIVDGVNELLKQLKIGEEDFQRVGNVTAAHKKITDEILRKWRETDGFGRARSDFVPRGSAFGLDAVGREWRDGRILMAVEVDKSARVHWSWLKLADIRSENKIWILVSNSGKADGDFRDAVGDIAEFLKSRNEDSNTCGNFIAFLKTPDTCKMEKIF